MFVYVYRELLTSPFLLSALFLKLALPQKPPWWTVFDVTYNDIEVIVCMFCVHITVSCVKSFSTILVDCVNGDIGSLSPAASVSGGPGKEDECFEGSLCQKTGGDQRS